MTDFVQYVVSELQGKRLSQAQALGLIQQWSARAPAALVHPLLHRNTSDLTQQSWATRFSGDEFLLRDHRVHGRMVLPAVAYLEMARAAVALALPGRTASAGLEIRHAAWAQPVTLPEHRDVVLALFADDADGDRLEVEVCSGEDTLHFQAQAVFGPPPAALRHDRAALAARMGAGRLDGAALYAAIARQGIALGPAQQGVRTVLRGEGELLVDIVLPDSLDGSLADYVLHPSVMDSAVQAAMALVADEGGEGGGTPLPFALETLRVLGGCGQRMFAWVRHAAGSGPQDRVVKLDIDLCDADGGVCVQMLGFSSRVLGAAQGSSCLLAVPAWEAAEVGPGDGAQLQRHVLRCGLSDLDPAGDLDRLYTDHALACFEQLQALLAAKPQGRVLLQVVVPNDAAHRVLAGLAGMLRTATQENPKLLGQWIAVDPGIAAEALDALLAREAQGRPDAMVRYENGQRQVQRWQVLEPAAGAPTPVLKPHGVYLITGGLGGLGGLFAKDILARAPDATVILAGRAAEPDAARLAALDGGSRLHYRRLDLGDAAQVAQVLAGVVREFGQLNGILHGAGTVQDSFMLKKTADELRQVFAPKVAGSVHLDAASAGMALDFFALFSSAVAVFGNAGQADYAAANGFMDGFAAWRNGCVAAGERHGTTLALNWPLWQDGGMAPDEAHRAQLERTTGMQPMQAANGLQAFHRGLQLGCDQLLVVEGDAARLRRTLFDRPEDAAPATVPVPAPEAGDLFEPTQAFLREQFAQVLKLAPQRLDPQAPLERYGIDSILAMDLTAQLERSFGSLPKTLFFEYQSIAELAAYFVRDCPQKLAALFSVPEMPAAPAVPAVPVAPLASRRLRRRDALARATPAAPAAEPIAIVGLSGRYPESPDVEAFWRNLRDGRDCIVEVPASRWDWREHYSDDRSAPGRHYSKWGGFIDGVDAFDPLFFNIPPVDAELIDPQERLFLQHAWMAVEDAGCTRAGLQAAAPQGAGGQVGVYVGVMYGEYQLFGAEASLQGERLGVPQSYASIANRVSYVLNVHGPSMTLDTMCSSSLTAIHLACQDLKQGRTHLAIAGGVNVTVHPNKYLILSAGQFISGDGHCQSFGEGGDGYIPGEGVGAVVLKRLSDALRDGNHVYGVIRGSALNHGGKTNGYSVPNPKAQAAVIEQALAEDGIDPRHVSYIEAHGTGTRLGDPIEIAALNQVFLRGTAARGFCALGSAKSNIGHCESAAGIAGLTKVLLQMKHRMLVPSLHSAVLNPHIDFAASAFSVNQALRPWERPQVDGRSVPRLAGISSFGAGGSNAHLVIEEFEAPAQPAGSPQPVMVPLSARTAAQLQQKLAELLAFIARQPAELDLPSLAWTLQAGREAMDHRVAVVVDSVAQLVQKLQAHADGRRDVDRCFHGQVDREPDGVAALGQDEDMQEAIGKWIARRKLAKLAELWVRGLAIDWRRLHGERTPGLLSLPAYPFAQERYWVRRTARRSVAQAAQLHPLLHANASDFFQQRYAAEFSGDEFFVADHRVGVEGRKLLPGVAGLEMARAAVELAWPAGDAARTLAIRDVAWTAPVPVDGPTPLALLLAPDDGSRIGFELRGQGGETLHCQGQVELSAALPGVQVDLAALEAQMTLPGVEGGRVYEAFAALGLNYGPAMRGVLSLRRGPGQVLAELALPPGAQDGFGLHPALLDSAFQAAIGLLPDLDTLPAAPAVPFALEALLLLAPCAPRMRAWVRHAAGNPAADGMTRVDIDLCDAEGRVCVQVKGLASRTLRAAETPYSGLLLASPRWEPVAPAAAASWPAGQRHQVLLCELPQIDPQRLQAALPGSRVTSLADADGYQAAALACFEQVQALLKDMPPQGASFQLVVADDGQGALLAGLAGLLETARLENPRFAGQMVLVEPQVDERTLAQQLLAARALPGETRLRCDGEALQARRWQEHAATEAAPAWRDDGVYLVTGGLGGLGRVFAKDILERAPRAVVVLTGRAPVDAAALAEHAARLGLPLERLAYRQLDLGQRAQVQSVVDGVIGEFGGLHGVLHNAGMVRDGFIVRKTAADVAAVLEPKVLGTLNLDLATRHVALDFIALFSSVASALGNVGQADYAAANGFMDRFAEQREALARAGQRHGRTLSLQWPLWQDGGMQLDAATLQQMAEASGMQPMRTESGLRAFHRGLVLGAPALLVIEGNVERLRRSLQQRHAAVAAPVAAPVDTTGLPDLARAWLVEQFAALLKMPAHEVDPKAPLERYGMDSVLAMKLTTQLEREFGSLSKTLLFEHQTLASLADYLAEAFPQVLRAKAGGSVRPVAAVPAAAPLVHAIPARLRLRAPAATTAPDDIAIIGLAGRYPQADDLQAFWRNLQVGRDSITEVPAERWDHAPFFHPARNTPGKTYSKWGGFLSGVDRFDALFFGISPKEAELIDPQERLFIETVWETIEDAGYGKEALARQRVGVYVGAMWGQYELHGHASAEAGVPSSSFASIANRVSYFFDFHGPSLALDTMCSSSLTAIHLACEALRQGTVDVAVAGGVNLTLHPAKYLGLSQGNFASTDGRCRSFGEGGDGYVPGEGVGAVLLKPLRQALQDGDTVQAVIKASAINHGGKTNGYTVPNPLAQSALVREALDKAGIAPATLGYIETHGTGTSLGDPIEVSGLVRAFDGRGVPQGCPIGSLKSNIGHLEAAAGIAALTKVLLQFRHGQLVPSLHAERLNPHIRFEDTPFTVQRTLADWPRPVGHPRRAAVSSFGAGGSNAHLVLEQFDAVPPLPRPQRPEAILLSARTRSALAAAARRWVAFLDANAVLPALADIAYTTQVGRTPMAERLVLVADTPTALKDLLQRWLAGDAGGVHEGSTRGAPSNAAALIEGEAGRAFLQLTLAQRDLAKLAKLWLAGIDVDWAALHAGEQPRRVSLPTYPFERERYWLEAAVQSPAQVVPEALSYRMGWVPAPLAVEGRVEAGVTLVLGGDTELLAQLPGQVVALSPVDLAAQLDALASRPTAIVHVVNEASGLDGGVFALHALCQALMARKLCDGLRIVCVQAGAPLALHRALGGYLKTLVIENPAIGWKLVSAEEGPLARIVADELAEASWRHGELRHRGGQREAREAMRCTPRGPTGSAVRQHGAYLVTGGLGGLGQIVARHLLQQYGARLLLTGRSAPDGTLLDALNAAAAPGGEAVYLQADVADPAQAERAVRTARERFAGLHGVIHGAGIHRDAFVLNKTRDEMAAVFGAKLQGTLNLDHATRDDALDLFVLFSSAAGSFGNAGQCDYAFANAFQDAFAEQRQAERPGRTLSIGWPLWEEGGMQVSRSDAALMAQRTGLAPLPTATGLQCLEAWLRSGEAHGITLHGDAAKIAAHVGRAAAVARALPVVAAEDAPALRAAAEHYLKGLLGGEIKLPVERIDAQERFEAFGVDSMMISRINAALERDLGALPKTLFYEYASIGELAGYLLAQARPALARHLGSEAPVSIAVQLPAPLPAVQAIAPRGPAEPIAIIGLHGRFPGAGSLDDYWQQLAAGRDLTGPVPAGRWDAQAFHDPDPDQASRGRIYCNSGGFVADADKFDAAFFSITPEDARLIDPQERLFIESVWAAVEDAGYTRDSLKRRHPKGRSADVGVFAGVTSNTYQLLTQHEWDRGNPVTPGSLPWSIANRVSYFFDFQGPSLPVDTACSSSLVALHLACESLRRGDCQVAVAGGVNLYLHPAKYLSLCRRRMLALDGRTRSFGAGDDGFIPGEGVGTVLLKPLSQALADGDHVHAVIASSACEHSGRSNGYSAPNPNSQALLIGRTLAQAGLDPEQIGYVEGHGTGTQLGDSLEVAALTQAFRQRTQKTQYCPLGSVKANVGHAEAAAGMAGLAKVLLQLRHRQLAPTIHAEVPNPGIAFADSPFYLQQALAPWDAVPGQPRRALINSFGAGGVNACVVIEEHVPAPVAAASTGPWLVVLSAKNEARLEEQAAQLVAHLQARPGVDLARLAYTLQAGRETMDERLAVVAGSAGDLMAALSTGAVLRGRVEPHRRKRLRTPQDGHAARALFERGDLAALATLWIGGQDVDWDALHGERHPHRVPLPGYPFAKERHWVGDDRVADASPVEAAASTATPAARLHPLVSHNTSTLREVSFASRLSGSAYYGRDHQVNGQALFPGAGFLELACINGTLAGEASVARLEDVVWMQPLRLDGGTREVRTVLSPNGPGASFSIVSFDADNEPVVHSEGRIFYGHRGHGMGTAAPACDIAALRQRALRTVPGADCYRQLAGFGFHYGPSFQTLQELHVGAGFALSRLQLADSQAGDFEHYLLHPSLVDGALQTVIGLVHAEGPDRTPHLPFALGEVEILRPLTARCHAHVEAAASPAAAPGVKRFDIRLLSDSGELLVRLGGFSVRALRQPAFTSIDS